MSASAKSIHVEVENGVVVHCLEWTSNSSSQTAVPVILLHGGGANAHWWDHLAAQIASTRPVYAVDFRGHGDSDYPREHRVGAFNDDLEALIADLKREDVFLFGHSLGAAVALDHASRFPATRGIALIDLARGSARGSRRRARLALSLRRSYRTRAEAIERFRFLPESSHTDESLRRYIAEHSVQPLSDGRFGYKFDPGWFSLPSRPRPDLTRIRCPALLIRGEESVLLSAPAALEFSRQLRTCQLIEIADAGHNVLIDQPEALLAILENFIRQDPQIP